jgi:hypothetical protein
MLGDSPVTPARRRPVSIAAIAIVLLVVGAVVAWGVGGALGLSFTPKTVPAEHLTAAPATPDAAVPPISAIAVPDDPRYRLAASAVSDALVGRGAAAPAITTANPGSATAGTLVATVAALPGAGSDEAYRLTAGPTGMRLTGATAAGVTDGLYRLADRIRSGEDALADHGAVVSPRLGLRLADVGAVGLDDDPATFATGTDYSLNTDIVGSALLPQAPWVDPVKTAEIAAQFHAYVDHALAEGYNGIVLPGFLEYVTFAGVGDGHAVYPAGDPHTARARAMVAAFGPIWKYAADMGMSVYLQTDMLAVSPPLKAYLTRTYGGLTVEQPGLWSVYQSGLSELFTSMPYLSGLMIRTGEGGSDYKLAGWDYTSEIDVTTSGAVQAMLRALLATADKADKNLIFRTWSVGVGPVGDLHTNPDSYAKVLDPIQDPHLIVSTKYSAGDFYSHLPLNPTLAVGGQKRIVEFQSRREFEGQGALPDDQADLEQQALRTFLARNPNIIGVWDWTQDGGPLYAGPRTLYLRDGFWQMWDLNVYLTARLADDPDTDTAAATRDWIRQTFSTDPATVAAIGQVMALSRQAVTEGLYIGPYAQQSVKALGLQPPPMMWIFEWDIVTGDSAALDSIYKVSRPDIDQALAQGRDAVALARTQQALLTGTDPATWTSPALRQAFTDTLAYQVNLFTTLDAYRTLVLRHEQWLDTGSASAKAAWASAETTYRHAVAAHESTYGHDIALPAYNFTAANLGLQRDDRDPAMAWLARVLLVLLAAVLALGSGPGQRLLRGRPGAAALRGLWLGATRPWRVRDLDAPAARTDRVLVWLVPAAALALSRGVYTWFLAPAHLILTLGSWLAFAAVLRLLIGRRPGFHLWAAVGGAALLRTVILLLALVTRGPGRYWFEFFTAPGTRTFYITVAFAAFAWVFVVAYWVLRDAYGLLRRRSAGRVLLGLGTPLVVFGTVTALIGAETSLSAWNDQMALLPWGLHRILGITTYLGIPTSLPTYAIVFGTVLIVIGAALTLRRGRRTADAAASTLDADRPLAGARPA